MRMAGSRQRRQDRHGQRHGPHQRRRPLSCYGIDLANPDHPPPALPTSNGSVTGWDAAAARQPQNRNTDRLA
jgi:hypothetical protein